MWRGGGRGIRTPKGLAPRWISSPLPYQLGLALRVRDDRYLRYLIRCGLRLYSRAVELLRKLGERESRADQALDRFGEVRRAR